jgi:hypothetical protein
VATAGAAALTYAAGKFATDGIQAALDQEKANKRVAQTLKNLGLDKSTKQVLDQVDAWQRLYGIQDDDLIPGYEKIVSVTKDTTKANVLMQTAMDLAAAKGITFAKASDIVAKAASGSYGQLKRVAPELGKIATTGTPAADVLGAVNKQFSGQAAANAATTAGSMERISVAWSEVGESFGEGFLDGFVGPDVDTALGNMQQAEDDVRKVGEALGNLATDSIGFGAAFIDGLTAIDLYVDQWALRVTGNINQVLDTLGLISDEEGQRRADAVRRGLAAAEWDARTAVSPSNGTTGGGNFAQGAPTSGYEDYRPMRYSPRAWDAAGRGDGRAAQRAARTRTRP